MTSVEQMQVGKANSCFRRNKLTHAATVRAKYTEKAVPLQAWTGPEGSRRLRSPDFKTMGI